MYRIGYDDVGNIIGLTQNKTYNFPGLTTVGVPEEYNYLFDLVTATSLSMTDIKVDMECKTLKLINLTDTPEVIDVTLGKITEILASKNVCDLDITFKTVNSKPHILVKSTHDEERTFEIYITKRMNVNYLYQTIICETNKVTTVEIDQLDYRDIFSSNFSLYYRKQFNKAGYRIE